MDLEILATLGLHRDDPPLAVRDDDDRKRLGRGLVKGAGCLHPVGGQVSFELAPPAGGVAAKPSRILLVQRQSPTAIATVRRFQRTARDVWSSHDPPLCDR